MERGDGRGRPSTGSGGATSPPSPAPSWVLRGRVRRHSLRWSGGTGGGVLRQAQEERPHPRAPAPSWVLRGRVRRHSLRWSGGTGGGVLRQAQEERLHPRAPAPSWVLRGRVRRHSLRRSGGTGGASFDRLRRSDLTPEPPSILGSQGARSAAQLATERGDGRGVLRQAQEERPHPRAPAPSWVLRGRVRRHSLRWRGGTGGDWNERWGCGGSPFVSVAASGFMSLGPPPAGARGERVGGGGSRRIGAGGGGAR